MYRNKVIRSYLKLPASLHVLKDLQHKLRFLLHHLRQHYSLDVREHMS